MRTLELDLPGDSQNAPSAHSKPLPSVRTLLLWLVLGCLLPGVIGVVFLFVHLFYEGREQLQKTMVQTARVFAQTVDSQFDEVEMLGQLMADGPSLAAHHFSAFHRTARETLKRTHTLARYMMLSDERGQQIVNTQFDWGTPLAQHGNPALLQKIFATGQGAVSDMYASGLNAEPTMTVDIPVLHQGKVAYVLSIGIDLQRLNDLLRQQLLPPGWVGAIFDSAGTIASRTHSPEKFIGKKAPSQILEALQVKRDGFNEVVTGDGVPIHAFFSTLPNHPWHVGIGIPSYFLETVLARNVALMGLGSLTLLGFGLALAGIFGRRIARSVTALTLPARELEAGKVITVPEVHFSEAEAVVQVIANSALQLTQRTQALTGTTEALQQLQVEIAERQRIQLSLEQSQLTLAQATRIAKIGSWRSEITDVADLYTRDSTWSPVMYDLLGYTEQSKPSPCVAAYFARVHVDDRLRLKAIAQQALAERKTWQTQYRLVMLDGRERLVAETGEYSFNREGQPDAVFGVVKDITEQKKAELALELYHENLEELVKNRTVELNDSEAEQRRLNRSLHMLSQCNMAIVKAQDELELLSDLCRLICEAGDFLLAWVGVAQSDADKTIIPVAQYGHASGYLQSIRVAWEVEQTVGFGPTCMAIRTGTTQIINDHWRNPVQALWREAGREQEARSFAALPLLHDQQTLGVLAVHCAAQNGFGRSEIQLLEELTRNIAFGLKALRARRELERYQLRLEELVVERTQEIAVLNEELLVKVVAADAASLAKSAFLATMSHELRTPLNAVIGLSGLMGDSSLNPRQRDYVDKIQLSGKALRALVDDILDFSKIEAGGLHLQLAPFSLKALLRATPELVCVNLGNKPVEALIDLPADLPDALMGDVLRLQQILLNLCSNAVKFTQVGEIVFSVQCLARSEDEVSLKFSVKDTGVGVSPDQIDTIFDAFTQGDSSISRHYGGTGLGLAISQRLAHLMGGRLSVESTVGVGSTFCFEVTLALGASPAGPERPSLLQGLRVLVVDDHPLARALHVQNCEAFGWHATAVASGPDGIEALRHSAAEGRDYDVLLLDWRMPGMDGLEMLRQANATPGIGLPLVVLMASTFELEQAALEGADLNLDGMTAKPLTPDGLMDAVARAYAGEFTEIMPLGAQTKQRLSGLRLLVAEDNPLNQEVIEQILTQAGAEVVLASNGLAAVAALRSPGARFDAALLDIQMPGMDGYATAKIIRQELGLRALPIIAVTAHARPEDREKSRLAGMVGHLVKPINVPDLLNIVVGVSAAVTDRTALATLDVASALAMFAGDKPKLLLMLHKFTAQHGDDVKTVRGLLDAQDLRGAQSRLHDLGGVASLFQAQALAALASEAELALTAGRLDQMGHLLAELDVAMHALQAAIHGFENSEYFAGEALV
jgi:two-component system sensor histidine kinase/response regulator